MKLEDYSKIVSDDSNLLAIYELTEEILKDYYATFPKRDNRTYIPIEEIAEWLGFKFIVKDLNRYNSNPNRLTASLAREEKVIYIASNIDISYADKRFAIAKMLGYFILSKESYKSCSKFRLNVNSDDYAAEAFASFILVPPIDLFKFINNYHEQSFRKQFNLEKYIEETSGYYKIPFVDMFATFERIKMLLVEINSKNKGEEDFKTDELSRKLAKNIPRFLSY